MKELEKWVMAELGLARLRRWNPRLRVWGLSATLGNIDEALDTLLAGEPGRVVKGASDKQVSIDTLIPAAGVSSGSDPKPRFGV